MDTSLRVHREEAGEERGSDFPGTRLQDYWQVWAKNHADPTVVSLLRHGYRLDFKFLPKLSKIPLILSEYHNKNKDGALHKAVQAMLLKKAITRVRKPTTLGYYSRLFLVPKPMKRWRPVIDLSMLNSHLNVPTFTMETAESIRKSIRKGEWVTSIDLTDAYFHVPIHPQSQKYLRFQTKKGVFQFQALPFGVATAPLEFTRIVKEVKLIAQARNLRIHQYLDDWLLRSPTKEQCLKDSEKLVQLVQELGWLINFQKSELVPTQKLDFLGYHFDLQRGLGFPTQKKLDRLEIQTVSIRKSLILTPRELMSFIGTFSFFGKNSTTGKVTHETIPVVPEVPLEISPVTGQKDSSNREFSKTSQMVGGFTKSYGRCSYPSSCTQHSSVHRCLTKRLGSSLK